ncbi:hypothetical protein IscW_ISCW018555 [Ixodes scapularis]|uniref:Uncharacterized protein n=1 Tax=Ixodes scapularis TaxID=6945 RepID=B7PPM6_IXOSC|nr:hypothetical protein IscW_ISCW018555 [Ixodes scapularis]|eukprot:XP_002435718.1 hypothetical protein IscW_ISCW018555 [Ixodes scapularis]
MQKVINLTRNQVIRSARGYLQGSQLKDALDAIENIEIVMFNSIPDRTRLESLYRDINPSKSFYVNHIQKFFFRRFCSSLCMMVSTFVSEDLLPPRDMCNIVVRNVLDFYTAFQCFPEDYMGEVEICKVF